MVAVRQIERPYTASDLATMPDDGRRYEVIGGELIVSPSPTTQHQRVSRRLTRLLDEYLERTGNGEVFAAPLDVLLGNHDILQPDFVIVLRENADRVTDAGIVGPPDLVVEILSPGSVAIDRVRKSATYATFGVPEYWIVDPATKTILAQKLVNGQYQQIESDDGLIRSEHITGLVIDPADVFALPAWVQASSDEDDAR